MIKMALINSDKDIHVCGTCQNIYDDINKFLNHKLECPLNKKLLSPTEVLIEQDSLLDVNNQDSVSENNYLLQFDERTFKDQFDKDLTAGEPVVQGIPSEKQVLDHFHKSTKLNSKSIKTKKKQKCKKTVKNLTTACLVQQNKGEKIKQEPLKKRSKNLKETFVTKTKRKNLCDVCGFVATYHRDLVRHMRKHTGEQPYTCRYCDKKFTRKDKLVSHERIHLGVKPFKCGECEYAGSDSGALRLHQLMHTGERQHRCQLCQYKARSASHLTVHLRTHTGDSPYFCRLDSCDRSFKTSSDLNRHMKMHKLDVYSSFKDKSQGYACLYDSEELLKNVKSCHVCQDFINTSISSCQKRGRRQRHTQCVRSHECPHCEASFVRQDSLRCHIKLHNAPSSSLAEEEAENDNDLDDYPTPDPPQEGYQELNQLCISENESLIPLETLMQCAIDTSAL